MILRNRYTQQCFTVLDFFTSWSSCFDRSSVIHSSIMELQDAVDNTRKTEKEMVLSHHHYDDFGEEHQCDRELSSSLLSYLVADTVDRVDQTKIKGGSFPFA